MHRFVKHLVRSTHPPSLEQQTGERDERLCRCVPGFAPGQSARDVPKETFSGGMPSRALKPCCARRSFEVTHDIRRRRSAGLQTPSRL
jgi:hypothetical protein